MAPMQRIQTKMASTLFWTDHHTQLHASHAVRNIPMSVHFILGRRMLWGIHCERRGHALNCSPRMSGLIWLPHWIPLLISSSYALIFWTHTHGPILPLRYRYYPHSLLLYILTKFGRFFMYPFGCLAWTIVPVYSNKYKQRLPVVYKQGCSPQNIVHSPPYFSSLSLGHLGSV